MKFAQLFFILQNIILLTVIISNGFNSDGSLPSLTYAHRAIMTTPDESTAVAIRLFNTSLIVALVKNDPFIELQPINIRKLSQLFFVPVGKGYDRLASWRRVQELNNQYSKTYGNNIVANILSLKLADDAHKKSFYTYQRSLAINSLVIGCDSPSQKNPSIYKIDVTGNYFKCYATSIGVHSEKIMYWLNTVGSDMIYNFTHDKDHSKSVQNHTSIINTNNSMATNIIHNNQDYNITNHSELTSNFTSQNISSVPAGFQITSSVEMSPEDTIETLAAVAWKCFQDVLKLDNFKRFRVEVAYISNGILKGPEITTLDYIQNFTMNHNSNMHRNNDSSNNVNFTDSNCSHISIISINSNNHSIPDIIYSNSNSNSNCNSNSYSDETIAEVNLQKDSGQLEFQGEVYPKLQQENNNSTSDRNSQTNQFNSCINKESHNNVSSNDSCKYNNSIKRENNFWNWMRKQKKLSL